MVGRWQWLRNISVPVSEFRISPTFNVRVLRDGVGMIVRNKMELLFFVSQLFLGQQTRG